LGATNPVTLTTGQIILHASSYTNKTLTIQGNNSYLDSQGVCTWAGPIVLVGNQEIYSYDDGPLNLAGPITGTGNLTVNTFDTNFVMVLSGSAANTFTGDLWMQVGTLELAKTVFDGAIPHNLTLGWNAGGNSIFSATNLYLANNQISNDGTVTLAYGSVMNLNNYVDGVGSLVLNAGTSVTTGTGKLDMYSPGTISTPLPAGTAPTISGTLGEAVNCTFLIANDLYIPANIYSYDSYDFTKTGPGNLYLSGANTYTGPTLVQQGWLWADSAQALGGTNGGTYVSSGATLGMGGSIIITNEPLTLNGPGVSTEWGSLDVESGINTWQGPITNNANSTLDSWDPGSQLHISGPISGPGSLELFAASSGGGTHFFEGSASNSYAGLTTVDAGATLVLNKSVANGALPGNLVVNNGGTARLGADLQMHITTDILINSGGLFDTGVNWDEIDTLHGSGSMNFGVNGYIEVGHNNGTSTFDGPMTGTGYTFGGYTVGKFGSGSFTMTGNSSFTAGAFHVLGGSLFENGLAPQVPAIVDSVATFGGSGTVKTITANGIIAPGNNSAGILTCTSNLTFSSTGKYSVDLSGPNPGSGYDQLNVAGTNVLANAGLILNMEFASPVSVGQQFTIINNRGPAPISGTFAGVPEGATFNLNGFSAKLSYVGGAGKSVVLTLLTVPGSVVSSTVTAGDGSHGIDPNGCNNLALAITNLTSFAMNNVTATLSTTTEGVVITQPYATYPDISANGMGTNITPFQISALPSFTCGTPINLQLSVKSGLGSFTVNYALQTGETASAPSRYDVSGNVAIPDIGSVDSTNVVSGFASTPIQKVVVSMYITHPFDSDLTNISLISPDGTTVLLSSANGGSGQNYGSGLSPDSLRTTFDDAAGTAITAGAAPFAGTFRPQSLLSAYAGNITANGNWHLHIADGFGGSLGTLRGWSLFLYGTTCNSGSGPCDYCLTSMSGTIINTDLVQTNRMFLNGTAASCGAAKSWPGGADLLGRHYDIYSFTNTTASDACVTAVLVSPGDLQAGIYLNAFNPTNIQSNYLADSGGSTMNNINNPQSCSATIPSGGVFYVTVDEVTPNTGGAYALQLSGLPCPPPTLDIQPVSGSKARLYWDTSGGGYVLESVSNLTATAWVGVTNEPVVIGDTYNVTNSTALPSTNQFYRLRKP
jgi:fibronectin-binding autotransporter adhesin